MGVSGVSAVDPIALAPSRRNMAWTGPPSLLSAQCLPRRELLNRWAPVPSAAAPRRVTVLGGPLRGALSRWQRSRRAWRGRVHPHCVDGSTSLWTDPLLRRLTRSTFIVRAVPAAEGAAESLGSGFPRRLFLGECLFREGRCGVLGRVGEDRDGPGVDGSTSLLWTGLPLRGLIHFFED